MIMAMQQDGISERNRMISKLPLGIFFAVSKKNFRYSKILF